MKRIPARTILKGVKCTSRPGDPHTRSGGQKPEETKSGYLPIWGQICRACDLLGRAEAVDQIEMARLMMEAQWRS